MEIDIKSTLNEYCEYPKAKLKKQNPEWYRHYYQNKKNDTKYLEKRREQIKIANRNWRMRKKEGITLYKKSSVMSDKEYYKTRWQKYKKTAINEYGGKCICCGEDRIQFLTFHHGNGDGKQHRIEMGKGGRIIEWMRKNNYPKDRGIVIYCWNCHLAITHYGECPHEIYKKNAIEEDPCKRCETKKDFREIEEKRGREEMLRIMGEDCKEKIPHVC